jgi:hypothetical protein
VILREFASHVSTGFPLAALAIFFVTFVGVLLMVLRRSADRYRDVANLPLEDEEPS